MIYTHIKQAVINGLVNLSDSANIKAVLSTDGFSSSSKRFLSNLDDFAVADHGVVIGANLLLETDSIRFTASRVEIAQLTRSSTYVVYYYDSGDPATSPIIHRNTAIFTTQQVSGLPATLTYGVSDSIVRWTPTSSTSSSERYHRTLFQVLCGAYGDLLQQTWKLALVNASYTPNYRTDEFFSTIQPFIIGDPVELPSVVFDGAVSNKLRHPDLLLPNFQGTGPVSCGVVYLDMGTAETSPLLFRLRWSGTAWDTIDGNDVKLRFSNSWNAGGVGELAELV